MSAFVEHIPYFDEGPIALIVGCGDMGMGSARLIGKRHPLLIVDNNAAKLAARVELLRDDGYTVVGRELDVTDSAAVEALGQSLANGPGVKVLAHVAGIGGPGISAQQIFAVDLIGPARMAEAVAPHMVRGGVIIQIASLAAWQTKLDKRIDKLLGDPLKPGFLDELFALHGGEPEFGPAYSYAKLGTVILSEKLAVQLGAREIRAVTVTPGMINTSIGRNNGSTLPASDGSTAMIARGEKVREIPLARQGTVNEIVAAIDFVASDAASFITGVELLVDGGQRAGWRDRDFYER